MRILQITSEAPGKKSGGQLGVAQTAESICLCNDVDYVGPAIEDDAFLDLYNNTYYLSRNENSFFKVVDLLKGVTSTYYRSWKKIEHIIDFDKYDTIVIDFTKFDFCIPKIKQKRIIVRVHNIEIDYSRKDWEMDRSIKKLLCFVFSKQAEKRIAAVAETMVFLHNEDSYRFQSIYGSDYNSEIIPVCVDEPKIEECFPHRGLKLLITGSLWFGSNSNGVKWIIENVLERVTIPYELMVVGSNPHPELIALCQNSNAVKLIASPEKMYPYFMDADVILAPIFDGAGMKVKIAEALSYGKIIIGTNHAFTGYDTSNKNVTIEANTAEEFAEAINRIGKMDYEKRLALQRESKELYLEKYAMKVSEKRWREILINQ